jgi:hypothetical protein
MYKILKIYKDAFPQGTSMARRSKVANSEATAFDKHNNHREPPLPGAKGSYVTDDLSAQKRPNLVKEDLPSCRHHDKKFHMAKCHQTLTKILPPP